jgi:hypothetical protein
MNYNSMTNDGRSIRRRPIEKTVVAGLPIIPGWLSDYSYRGIHIHQTSFALLTYDNRRMAHTADIVALCCYKNRAVVSKRCDHCTPEYGCSEFKSKAALVQFNALIPPSMLLAPLPIELWPNMCGGGSPEISSQPARSASGESTESPVRRFVSTLGLPLDPNST